MKPTNKGKQAGKGSDPRNCFSNSFKNNYDLIKWGEKKDDGRKKDKN